MPRDAFQIGSRCCLGAALYPVGVMSLAVLDYAWMRLVLGHPPMMYEDEVPLGAGAVFLLVGYGIPIAFFVQNLAWAFVAGIRLTADRPFPFPAILSFYIGPAAFAYAYWDPLRLIEWALD